MQFKLTEDQQMIRDLARDYAQNYIAPRVEEIETAEKFPQDLFQVMAEMGFNAMNFPEAYGGMELGYLTTSMAIEEVSKVCPSVGAIMAVTMLPLEAINLYGTEEQKQKFLVPGLQGEFKGSFAFTEADTGSDPKMLKTVAEKTGEGTYKITGVKRFISNAAYEGPIVLFAKEKENGQCTAFIINKFCKGYSLSTPWEKVGLHGSHVYDVFLDEVEVTEADILGEHGQGFDILIGTTAYGKLAFSSVFTGAMGGAYDLAVKYAKEKLHRDKPIAKFPTIQVAIAQIAGNVMSTRMLLYKCAEDADEIKDIRGVQASTALVKGHVAKMAPETIMMALNVLGSYGVTEEYKVERLMRDSMIAPNVEGAGDVQRIIAGNYILRN